MDNPFQSPGLDVIIFHELVLNIGRFVVNRKDKTNANISLY